MVGSGEGGDRRQVLVRAVEDALAQRGTVVVEADGDADRWCAVCTSVQGDVEVRVAEPRRGWRRWKPGPGEAWLADNEFVHRIDAWSRPMRPHVGAGECAAVLDEALSRGLGIPPTATLRRSLVVPGAPPIQGKGADLKSSLLDMNGDGILDRVEARVVPAGAPRAGGGELLWYRGLFGGGFAGSANVMALPTLPWANGAGPTGV